jgi:hypothetical protein
MPTNAYRSLASLSAGADQHLSKCEFGEEMPSLVTELLGR